MIQDAYDMSQFLQRNQAENVIKVWSVNSLEHVGWLPDQRPPNRHVLLELPAVILYPVLQV